MKKIKGKAAYAQFIKLRLMKDNSEYEAEFSKSCNFPDKIKEIMKDRSQINKYF